MEEGKTWRAPRATPWPPPADRAMLPDGPAALHAAPIDNENGATNAHE
jgi:hypothetical protein